MGSCGACRETASIWQHIGWLFGKNSYRLRWGLFRKRLWKSKYLWHDSFGKYLNRFIICPILGHRHVVNLDGCCGEPDRQHCFKCERAVQSCVPEKSFINTKLSAVERVNRFLQYLTLGPVTEFKNGKAPRSPVKPSSELWAGNALASTAGYALIVQTYTQN